MRKLLVLVCLLTVGLTQAQKKNEPLYEKDGDLIRVTYFHNDGSIQKQGYFKNKKVTGTWTTFDSNGTKTAVANYKDGKKIGTWYILGTDGLKEIVYNNNKVVSVKNSNVALK